MIIDSRAPTRIDLAGGTVDLWPLFLFLNDPVTINLGIDLWAMATLEETDEASHGGITLKSKDQGVDLHLAWDELLRGNIKPVPALELHVKLARHFAREKESRIGLPKSLLLSTQAMSPAGAGLGGSSTLSIAMVGALATWAHGEKLDPLREGERYIEIVRDVETTVIQVPAGVQDYYGAMFGGLQALKWGFGSHRREWLSQDVLTELEQRILLFYSGQSRNSGINNWVLFKGFIDRQAEIREKFAKIAAAAARLEAALRDRDWKAAGQAISDEWNTRRTLASGISTPEIDRAFDYAYKEGAAAGKICGAGGGGCFFIYLPSSDPELASRVRTRVESLGIKSLPFSAVPRGLEIQVKYGGK